MKRVNIQPSHYQIFTVEGAKSGVIGSHFVAKNDLAVVKLNKRQQNKFLKNWT